MDFFKRVQILVLLISCCFMLSQQQNPPPQNLTIANINPVTGYLSFNKSLLLTLTPGNAFAGAFVSNIVNSSPKLLPNTTLIINTYDTSIDETRSLLQVDQAVKDGANVIAGPSFNEEAIYVASQSQTARLAMVAGAVSTSELDDRFTYQYFNRLVPSVTQQSQVFIDLLLYFYEETGQKEWLEVGVISTSVSYGVTLAARFIDLADFTEPQIEIATYQQILSFIENSDLTIDSIVSEITELSNSGARVFLAFMQGVDSKNVLSEAYDQGIVGEKYVWICADGCANRSGYIDLSQFPTFPIIDDVFKNYIGAIGVSLVRPFGPIYELYRENFFSFFAARNVTIARVDQYSPYTYDSLMTCSIALDILVKQGAVINATTITNVIPFIEFEGTTGLVNFDSLGNRKPVYSIVNLWDLRDSEDESYDDYHTEGSEWVEVGRWNTSGLNLTLPFRFFNGKSDIPDLDVRKPFDYWSCSDKKERTDETGKTIFLDTPQPSASNIASTYICDQYIDCYNMSDEMECGLSLPIAQIVFIFIILFIVLIIIGLIIFTIVFGVIIVRNRVKSGNVVLLLVTCVFSIVGLLSLFSLYGMDTIAGCVLRLWLLTIPLSIIVSLQLARALRIFRIFHSIKKTVPLWQLFIIQVVLLVPVLIILFLWTLLATPVASKFEADGNDHHLCNTGGFINHNAAGYTFFSLIIVYHILVLLITAAISFITRNIGVYYGESRIVSVIVYNTLFSGIVCLIIYFIITTQFWRFVIFTCFYIWIIVATLGFQYIPMILGLLIYDKCQNKKGNHIHDTGDTNTGTNTGTGDWFSDDD
eukprot:TRINITY_DN3514_c0_g2_i1.p1 TRINITY_DN3514_c0_g2~~TRINITY_DN3514_c0_g2_i1.p1  ORF type:complete len:815 (+),score=216.77 TRINITY_DN3514_c0_g2_i1:82-2526(+)